jgi:hypothetical protein
VATEPPPGTPVQGAIDVVARVGVIPGQAPPAASTTTVPDND